MRIITCGLAFLGIQAPFALAAFRPDIGGNVPVAELEPGQTVPEGATEIPMKVSPSASFSVAFKCTERNSRFAFSEDKRFVACCLPGQHLSGSEDTGFDCCGQDHELAGSVDVGYICCPTGHVYDGNKCKPRTGGGDHSGGHDGHHDDRRCSSGIETGKCYAFKYPNGHLLGYHAAGAYYGPAPESRIHRDGRFQLCKDEACAAGLPINPGDGIHIKDLNGDPNTGARPGHWLNNAFNGGHITKTPNFATSGAFTLTKWPCGKYCLGGVEAGVGPTCPADVTGSTFLPNDKDSCVTIELIEVPCDIRDPANNCIWKKGDECCGKIDCAGKRASHASCHH